MTVSGGMKFFKKNWSDIDYDLTSFVASSGDDSKDFVRDRRTYTKWQSVGSDDLTTETLEIEFSTARDIDRLCLVKNNFKDFNVQYWTGAAYTDFADVVTKEGTQASVTETANTKETNYYEFTQVSTTKIKLSVTETQTVDAEKYLYQFIMTEEIGTFTGYPQYAPTFNYNQNIKRTINGKQKVSLLNETFGCSLSFSNYTNSDDHAIIHTLWNDQQEFLIYPCGADESQFRYDIRGNRLEDIYLVWFSSTYNPQYLNTIYQLPLNYMINLVEVA